MTKLREYRPEDDPNPERMDGKMSRHRSRWFHDMLKALRERGENELAHHLETQLLAAYFDMKLGLPFPHEEFDQRFRACMQSNKPPASKLERINHPISGEREWWFHGILMNIYERDSAKVKAWVQMGTDAGAPEDFLETLTERYNDEWSDEALLKPDRSKRPEYTDESLDSEVSIRRAELFCFQEIAKQEGNIEKANLIHQEYERLGKLKVVRLE